MKKYEPVTQDRRRKLSNQQIEAIRSAAQKGESNRSIARRFDLSESYIWRVVKGIARKTEH